MLPLQFLSWGVPSSSHLLNINLSSRDLPLFHDRPMVSEAGSLDIMVLEGKVLDVAPITALC